MQKDQHDPFASIQEVSRSIGRILTRALRSSIVVDLLSTPSRVREGVIYVLRFEVRVQAKYIGLEFAGGQQADDSAYRNPQSPNAGLATRHGEVATEEN